MKIFKSLIFMAVAATAALPASAEDEFYALLAPETTQYTVNPGEQFDITLSLDNNKIVSSFQFRFGVPEGLSVAKNKKKYVVSYSDRMDPEAYAASAMAVANTNDVLFVVHIEPEYNTAEDDEYKIQPGQGSFVTVGMKVDDDVTPGDYEVTISKIKFATMAEEAYVSPDAVINVHVDNPTGVEAVTADDSAAEYFNLQGMRVQPGAHGLYLRRSGTQTTKIRL